MSKALECGAGQYTTAIEPVDDIKLRNSIDSVAKIAEKTPVPAQILTHSAAGCRLGGGSTCFRLKVKTVPFSDDSALISP